MPDVDPVTSSAFEYNRLSTPYLGWNTHAHTMVDATAGISAGKKKTVRKNVIPLMFFTLSSIAAANAMTMLSGTANNVKSTVTFTELKKFGSNPLKIAL